MRLPNPFHRHQIDPERVVNVAGLIMSYCRCGARRDDFGWTRTGATYLEATYMRDLMEAEDRLNLVFKALLPIGHSHDDDCHGCRAVQAVSRSFIEEDA